MKSPISVIPAGILCKVGNNLKTVADSLKESVPQTRSSLHLAVDGINETRPYVLLESPDFPAMQKEKLHIDELSSALDEIIPDRSLRSDVPFILGSTGLNISDTADSPSSDSSLNAIAQRIAVKTGLGPHPLTTNTACTSGATALILAQKLLYDKNTHYAVASAFDWYSKQIFYGFESLKLLSADECRPFDISRNGILLGEGAASVILSRGDKSPVKLRGTSLLLDTYDQTTHQPDGSTIALCMEQALIDAGIGPEEIDSIKAHGTGSTANDLAESGAIRKIFGNRIPAVVALKPFTGHTLGACGLVELLVHIATITSGYLPAAPSFHTIDPACGIELCQTPVSISFPHTTMLCSFGFGGSCAVIIITIERPVQW